MYYHWR
jgi:CRP-like cAMP-binding protein